MIDGLIAFILALIMFGIGLSLQPANFRNLWRQPKVLFLGLCLQLLLLPGLAITVSFLLDLPPAFAAGVLVLAACPGGLTSNFISYLLRANTALAVSLTICNTALSLITIPFYVNLALRLFEGPAGVTELPLLPTVLTILAIVLAPVALGMWYRARKPLRGQVLQERLRWLSVGLLALLFCLKVFAPAEAGGSELSWADVRTILPASVLINILALSSGRVFGSLFGYDRDAQLTLGVEVGIQNTSLAFMVTSGLLGNEEMLKPALIYAMFTFFTALFYGYLLKPTALRTLLRPQS